MIYVPIILYTARLNLSNFLAKLQSREFQGFEKVESIVGVGGGGWGGGKITDASVENVGNRQVSLVSEVNTNDCNRTQRPRKAIMDKFDRT